MKVVLLCAVALVAACGGARAGCDGCAEMWAHDYFDRMAEADFGFDREATGVGPQFRGDVEYRFSLEPAGGAQAARNRLDAGLLPMLEREKEEFGEAMSGFRHARTNYMFDIIFSGKPLELQYEMLKRMLKKKNGGG